MLAEALTSVREQTYPHLEVIAVDDGSTEDVEETVERFREQAPYSVRFLRQQNAGPGMARRAGLRHAQGEFIQYLDSDDLLHPDKIRRQVGYMREVPDAVMCYTPAEVIAADGTRKMRKFSCRPANDLLATALQYRRWGTPSCLWRYSDRDGACWAPLYNGEDVVHDVRVGVRQRRMLFLPEVLTYIRVVGGHAHTVPEGAAKQERFREDVLQACLLSHEALVEHGLERELAYAEPLAERFYHCSLLLAKLGDQERAVKLFQMIPTLSRRPLRLTEAWAARLAVDVSRARSPQLYRLLFRLHRKLVPAAVHCYRSV